jgi:HEAT repeat protein
VIGLGLRQVQEALNRKADEIQREFVAASERLEEIGSKMLEGTEDERRPLRAEQTTLRERQQVLADEINLWRERGRRVLTQPGQASLRGYLNELLALEDPGVTTAVKHAFYLMDAPEEELERLSANPEGAVETPAGRLLKRAHTEYDMRGTDPAPRLRSAVEFANRPGMAQDDDAIQEIEAALQDADPLVREVAALTAIQLHKFRALRIADLDIAHRSAQRLAQIKYPAAIPVLVEILEKPRTGFVPGPAGPVEKDNGRSRMVALLRLVEWHTGEAQKALRARQFDRDPNIVKAAARALDLFPGEWTGPLTPTGSLRPRG